MRTSSYKKYFTRQQGQSDCGVACLASIIKYYGGEMRLERLREISGTSKKGTTLLGLYQGAQTVGFEAQGCEGTMEDLLEQKEPCILHVIKEERLQHYVIFYGTDKKGNLIISDPADGVKTMTESELEEIWKTKHILLLSPSEAFVKSTIQAKEKWKWLKELVRDDVNILTTAILIGAFLSILGLATAIFSKILIDDILPSNDPKQLWAWLGLLAFIMVFRIAVSAVRGTLILRQSVGFNKRIINYFYSSLIHLPQTFFDNRNTGEFMARMGDTGRIQRTITATLGGILINFMNMIAAGVAIFYYSTPLGLVALIYIPFYITFTYFYHKPIVKGQREVMQAHAKNQSNYIDTIQGISVIKTNNKQNTFNRLTQSIYGFLQQKIYDLGMIRIKFGIVVQICGAVLSISIISWSASMVLNKTMLLGEMMAILQMIGMFSGAIAGLAGSYVTIQEAKVAFDRMMEFTTIEREHDPEIEATKEPLVGFKRKTFGSLIDLLPSCVVIFSLNSYGYSRQKCLA